MIFEAFAQTIALGVTGKCAGDHGSNINWGVRARRALLQCKAKMRRRRSQKRINSNTAEVDGSLDVIVATGGLHFNGLIVVYRVFISVFRLDWFTIVGLTERFFSENARRVSDRAQR